MPRISLTDFVDIVSRVGLQKITRLSEIKKRLPYSPQTDYWKSVRDHLVNNHVSNGTKGSLHTANQLTSNTNKIINYDAVLSGYKTFWGRKSMVWFQPPSLLWSTNGLDVSLNPEMGLEINGDLHVIKLYFKADPLSKAKVDLILFLMHQVLPSTINGKNVTYGILDARNAKHIVPTGFNQRTTAALQGEAQYIATVWPTL
jgi:hypothetical protein